METLHAVRHDHTQLRKKLTLLESAIFMAPDARYVLREMCFSLYRMLQDHIAREAPPLQMYAHLSPAGQDPAAVEDHTYPHSLLRAANDLLLTGTRASMPTVNLWLSKVIELLRQQMDDQERVVFPALRASETPTPASPPTLSSAMSVNEVLQRYPETQRCFERLHVNRVKEGYESVNEVAWHHGMDVSQLMEQLRQAATARQFDAADSPS